MNAAGDLLRVATNAPNAEGNRAIGTYIPPRRRPAPPATVWSSPPRRPRSSPSGDAASGGTEIADSLNVVAQSVGGTRSAVHDSPEADATARRLTALVDRVNV